MANDIAAFPMVMAVSQDAINAQMALVYGRSTHEKDMFPHVPWNFGAEDGSWGVSVEQFAAPEVDFDTQLDNGCRLKMTIMRGQYNSFQLKKENGHLVMKDGVPVTERVAVTLSGETMYVTTPMKQVRHDAWTDEYFEVQGLFADLENCHRVELELSEKLRVAIGGGPTAALETLLADRIKEIGGKDPQGLLFGAVKIPAIKEDEQSKGPLKPSASTYSTVKIMKSGAYTGGDLNYLLLTNDVHEIPAGGAVGVLDHSLRRDGDKATLVLSDALVLEQCMKPVLEAAKPGIKLKLDRGDVVAGVPAKLYLEEHYGFGMEINGRGRSATLTKCESTVIGNKIHMAYHVESSVYQVVKDLDCSIDGYQDILLKEQDGKFTYTIDSPKPNTHVDDPPLGLRIIFDVLTLGFNELALKLSTDSAKDSMEDVFTGLLSQAQLVLDMLVLPGEKVWEYKAGALDGQLYISARYE